jgi:hypothetical protein
MYIHYISTISSVLTTLFLARGDMSFSGEGAFLHLIPQFFFLQIFHPRREAAVHTL